VPVELVVEHVLTALIFGATMVGIVYSPLFRAFGNRIMHGRTPAPGSTPLPDPRLDDLLDDNAALRRHLDELSERLEFTERMLAQAKDRGLLNAPRANG
jgi:hypothetical protein